MDRRSFLKALGTTFAGCSLASVVEAAIPSMYDASQRSSLSRMPSIKVIGIGRTGIGLMQSIPIGPDALARHVQADYLSIRFDGRITRGIEPSDMEWTMPLDYHRWHEAADDLHNVAAARQKIPGMERELSAYVKDADFVLLLIGLDNAMSHACCDAVARIARQSGALTVALVGVPYGQSTEDFSEESLLIASHEAVNRILRETDCVITSEGIWGGFAGESVSWNFGYPSLAPSQLLSAIWAASTTGDSLDRLKRALSSSGKAIYGAGIGDSAREAIEDALGEYQHRWFDSYEKATTAAAAIVIVSGHPKSVNIMLNQARIELARTAPLKAPTLVGKPEMLFLAVADDSLEIDGYFFVSIISTGIEFAGEP
ncbi:MAG: hypothetical protein Q8O64_16750 [Sideroxyarcus sp.]|nr:hypothetical protein [Sideroxyarcus sp.]